MIQINISWSINLACIVLSASATGISKMLIINRSQQFTWTNIYDNRICLEKQEMLSNNIPLTKCRDRTDIQKGNSVAQIKDT